MVSYFGENFSTPRHPTIQILTEWQTIRSACKYHGTEIQNLWRSGLRLGIFLCYDFEAALNSHHVFCPTAFYFWGFQGKTGFPWIDAIMIQLRQEGWIHHLARHAVACFLTRGDLWMSWEEGMKVNVSSID